MNWTDASPRCRGCESWSAFALCLLVEGNFASLMVIVECPTMSVIMSEEGTDGRGLWCGYLGSEIQTNHSDSEPKMVGE